MYGEMGRRLQWHTGKKILIFQVSLLSDILGEREVQPIYFILCNESWCLMMMMNFSESVTFF